ncbi:glycosyltransferase [Chamaesiphon sp.]|uniref:glycosyltransferase n=1 Tax=Chamaesiphon sp. TaxID=2814140 RepID=UPI0035945C32
MKITLICQEIPYPAMHGSRIDMWRRIKAFAERGVELQLIFWWFGTPPTTETIAQICKYASKLHPIQIEQTSLSRLRRITDLFSYPLETSSRLIKGQKLANLMNEARDFNPDIIFLDGIHGGAIATRLSQELQVPMVTRSHNIEHLYAQKMFAAAISIKDKFRRYLAMLHLERYEKKLLASSALFYDISADDLRFWQAQNLTNGRLLPPLIELAAVESPNIPALNESYDIVFLGNLNAENNVAGVIWFLTEVLPLIRDRLPQVTVLIAGFKPVDRIVQICHHTERVSLQIDPISASDTYQSGKVLINPILTGSGVKIKSIEMLQFGKPIVSTSEGVSGLPTAVKQYFSIANEPATFAATIGDFLLANCTVPPSDCPGEMLRRRQLLQAYFGGEIIDKTIAEIQSIVRS